MYYTVVRGDNLSRIAAKHGVKLEQLIVWNPQIKNPSKIYAGQKIVVGMSATGSAATVFAVEGEYYTVQKNDNLNKIAKAHKLSLEQLRDMNPRIFAQKYIYAGQKIRVK